MSKNRNIKHIFNEIPTLKANRLILRGVEVADAPHLIDLAVYDGFHATNEADVLRILEKINHDQKMGDSIQWVIQLKETADIIGLCSYHRGYPNNVGEVGYVLKPDYRGQGFMTEAVQLMVDFGLKTMQLNAVVAYTAPDNFASINVLSRAGFQRLASTDGDLMFIINPPADAL